MMRLTSFFLLGCCGGLSFGVASSFAAATAEKTSPAPRIDFARDIAPLLKTHCFECHTGDEPEADFNLSFKDGGDFKARAANERLMFEKMSEVLHHHEMPPEEFHPQPTDAERERLIAWIKQDLLAVETRAPNHSGSAATQSPAK